MFTLKCVVCGKDIKPFHCYRTLCYNDTTYEYKYKPCCSQECVNKQNMSNYNKYFHSIYKGTEIYKIGNRYMWYLGCDYYFSTLEEIKTAIDRYIENPFAVAPEQLIGRNW